MTITIHPHARDRMAERGATEEEVCAAVNLGEQFPVKHGRQGFRRNFSFDENWQGKHYNSKQVEVFATSDNNGWLVITVIVKYF